MRARLTTGPLAGGLVFLVLFGLGLVEAGRLQYMGETDPRWVELVLGRYGGEIARFQALLLAAYLTVGATLGLVAALARTGAVRRAWSRAGALAVDAGLVLLLHGAVLGLGVQRRPAAYAAWLYESGEPWATLQVVVTDAVPWWALAAVPFGLGLLAVRGVARGHGAAAGARNKGPRGESPSGQKDRWRRPRNPAAHRECGMRPGR